MSRRILLALTSVIALALSVIVVSPAAAVPQASVLHDTDFDGGQQPAVTQGGDIPMSTTAMSADGERIIMASNPRGVGPCGANVGPIWIMAGTATSTATTWQSPLSISLGSSVDCGLVRELKVSLSADGTRGLVTWIANQYDTQAQVNLDPEVRFATFEWPLSQTSPMSIEPPQTFAVGGYVNYLSHALAADGSRAVLSFLADAGLSNGGYAARYVVVDMEHPEFARAQTLPVPFFEFSGDFPVSISADGEVIAIGTYRNTGSFGSTAFREMKVFTCQANCYPKRLKQFSVMLPTSQGSNNGIDLDMNDSGSRLVVSWARTYTAITGSTVPARALRALVISPMSGSALNNVTSSVQYINTVDFHNHTLDVSPDGTRFVLATLNPVFWGVGASGTSKVSSGTIASNGKLAVTNVSALSSASADIVDLQLTGSPERVFVSQRLVGGATQILASDSTALKYWSEVQFVPSNQSRVTFSVSSAAARAVTSSDQPCCIQMTIPRVVVTNIKSVLGASVAPSISGVPALGKTLTVKNGTWNATGTFTYQWLRDGVELAGEDGPTFEPEQADAGSRISVRVIHSKPGYYDRVVHTAETAIVTGGIMTVASVSVSDTTPQVGNVMSWTTTGWSPSGGTFSFAWKVGGKVVGTGMSYTIRPADVGKTLTLTLTKARPGFITTSRTTDATAPIAP